MTALRDLIPDQEAIKKQEEITKRMTPAGPDPDPANRSQNQRIPRNLIQIKLKGKRKN